MNQRVAHALAGHGVDLLRISSGLNARVQQLLSMLEAEIVGRMAKANLSATTQSRYKAVLRDVRNVINETYGAADDLLTNRMIQLASTEAQIVAGAVNHLTGIATMDGLLPAAALRTLATDTLVMGAPSADWWARQSGSLVFRFMNAMRLGMAQGETNGELIKRVRGDAKTAGLMEVSRNEAEALVRTSVQTVANRAREATFKENKDVLKGWQQISTLDSRTTEICIAYDQQAWDLDGRPLPGTKLPYNGGCPRHWSCRSSIVPVVKSWRELGLDIDEFEPAVRASINGEVSAKVGFDDWFQGMTEAQQNEQLGKGKAELWRAGKITLQQLLDQRGRPLTLSELRARHGLAA